MNRAEQEARDIEELMGAKKYWGLRSTESSGVCGNSKLSGNEGRIMIRKIEPREFFKANPSLGQYDIVIDEPKIEGLQHDFLVIDDILDVKRSVMAAIRAEEQKLTNAIYSEMLKAFGMAPRKNKLLLLCGR